MSSIKRQIYMKFTYHTTNDKEIAVFNNEGIIYLGNGYFLGNEVSISQQILKSVSRRSSRLSLKHFFFLLLLTYITSLIGENFLDGLYAFLIVLPFLSLRNRDNFIAILIMIVHFLRVIYSHLVIIDWLNCSRYRFRYHIFTPLVEEPIWQSVLVHLVCYVILY